MGPINQAMTEEESPGMPTKDVTSFGAFSLIASERSLTKEGVRVELGARALDTLIALVSCPNEVVTKRDLLAQVWPDSVVDEGSVRFHIASLRKALGDGEEGSRYITTVAGRGYCFVAPISRSLEPGKQRSATGSASFTNTAMPSRLTRMVGRIDETGVNQGDEGGAQRDLRTGLLGGHRGGSERGGGRKPAAEKRARG